MSRECFNGSRCTAEIHVCRENVLMGANVNHKDGERMVQWELM